jgi:hypothetical protein
MAQQVNQQIFTGAVGEQFGIMQNWQQMSEQDFKTRLDQDRFYQDVYRGVAGVTGLMGGEQPRFETLQTAAVISNVARGSAGPHLASMISNALRIAGIESERDFIPGFQRGFLALGGFDTFGTKEEITQIISSMTDDVARPGSTLHDLGYKGTGMLFGEAGRLGLFDFTGGKLPGLEDSPIFDRLQFSRSLDNNKLQQLDQTIKSQMDLFAEIAKMGERYGIQADEILSVAQFTTGGAARDMILFGDGPEAFQRKFETVLELGRGTGLSGPEVSMLGNVISQSMVASGIDPIGSLDVLSNVLGTAGYNMLYRGPGSRATQQEYMRGALNAQMHYLNTRQGKALGFALRGQQLLSDMGVTDNAFEELVQSGLSGVELHPGEVTAALMQAGVGEGQAIQMSLGNWSGQFAEQITNAMATGAASPQSVMASFRRSVSRFLNDDDLLQYREGLIEAGRTGNIRSFIESVRERDRSAGARLETFVETWGNLASTNDPTGSLPDRNAAINALVEDQASFKQRLARTSALMTELMDESAKGAGLHDRSTILNILEGLSQRVTEGKGITSADILELASAGFTPEKGMKAIDLALESVKGLSDEELAKRGIGEEDRLRMIKQLESQRKVLESISAPGETGEPSRFEQATQLEKQRREDVEDFLSGLSTEQSKEKRTRDAVWERPEKIESTRQVVILDPSTEVRVTFPDNSLDRAVAKVVLRENADIGATNT